MSEEFDVFANANMAKSAQPANAGGDAQQQGKEPQAKSQPKQKPQVQQPKRQYHTAQQRKQFQRPQKQNNSPIRGANGSESVNPLLNAPLPAEQRGDHQELPANANRDPSLPSTISPTYRRGRRRRSSRR